eukprot:TRINITY_DN6779_c0_g1_i1.p2 TRINITY_DN6779_c0_g1~~TRINITY_DN6779_c0_g1_i1.p2  ORF type:complete len:797 (+),score=239.18 TRINITY_DN6779_c0_g1_i1:79-2469(+)
MRPALRRAGRASAARRRPAAAAAAAAAPVAPLEGLLVVAWEQAVAAPYCTSRLADAGARVIKVERDDGRGDFARGYDTFAAGSSSYFVWLNRGKESVCLDLKSDPDRELLGGMLAAADVFVQNVAPGAAERAGFGARELRERHPRLITVALSGYGDGHAYEQAKAYDLLVQAESGLCALSGPTKEQPTRVGVSACDIACGMYAHAAVLEALIARERTGRGCAIDCSLFSSAADWMTVPLLHYEADGEGPRPAGLQHPSVAPYGAFPTAGGAPILISVQNEREFAALCSGVLGSPQLPSDPRFCSNVARVANREALDDIIGAAFRSLPRAELLGRLRSSAVAFGEVNGAGGFSRHPALRRSPAETPGGPVSCVAPPARFDGAARPLRRVPALGEHSKALRAEFGRSRRCYCTQAGDDDDGDIRAGVRALCAQFPGRYWRELDERREYPTAFVKAMTDAGYLSILIPEEYGGSGLGIRQACSVLEEVHRSGCNAGAAHAQMYTMGSILHGGSREQKEKWLPQIASGELRLQAFGVSEANNGTDTLSLATTAVPDGDDWVVTGSKQWTSRAEHSDLMVLLARTGQPGTPRQKALSVFLVDMRGRVNCGKGIDIKPIRTVMNHSTTQVFFDKLRVPRENLIGSEGAGFGVVLRGMNAERTLIAAECIGDGRFFIDRATAYANERTVFGRPIGQNQGVQFPIAEAHIQLEAAALMVDKAARLFDTGKPCGAEANMAKHLAAEASWKAADVCMQTHGGYGFACEYDIERKWRETRLYRVAPISTNFVLSFIAEKVLGMPRSY